MDRFPYPVNLLVEGSTDEAIVRCILEHVGLTCGTAYGKMGKSDLLKRLPRYNQAAHFAPWLAVVDLDQEPECAPLLVQAALPDPAPGMKLRVAVHAIEAWLFADAERLSAFLSVPTARIPPDPDVVLDPKQFLVDLARRSRRRAIREDMVPRKGSGARVGPGYTGRLVEFVTAADARWRPEVAQEYSRSLRGCIKALQRFKAWKF